MTNKEELAQLLASLEPTIDELPGDLSAIARVIEKFAPGLGVRCTMALSEHYKGTYVLFHTIGFLKRKARDRWIIEQYGKGTTAPELARAADLGVRRVWDILGKEPVDDKQMSLW